MMMLFQLVLQASPSLLNVDFIIVWAFSARNRVSFLFLHWDQVLEINEHWLKVIREQNTT